MPSGIPQAAGRRRGPLEWWGDELPFRASLLHGLALDLAGSCCVSGRGAECRGGGRIVPVVSCNAGHEDSSGAGQRIKHSGAVARAAHFNLGVSPRRWEEPASCMAHGAGRSAGWHGRSGGAAEHTAADVHAPGAVAAAGGGAHLCGQRPGFALAAAPQRRHGRPDTSPAAGAHLLLHHRGVFLHWLFRRRRGIPADYDAFSLRLPGPA